MFTTTFITALFLVMNHSHSISLELSLYPKEIFVGDTFYVQLFVKNTGEETIQYFPESFNDVPQSDIQIDFLLDSKWIRWIDEYVHNFIYDVIFSSNALKPGENRLIYIKGFQFPPLEDFRSEDWEDFLKNLPDHGKNVDFRLTYIFYDRTVDPFIPIPQIILTHLMIKPRSREEMNMIEYWYRNTPKEIFPETDRMGYPGDRKIPRNTHRRQDSGKNVILGYSPWKFISTGNRYPSDPNAPKTWQGWKELEESITPSTMRDEIRLTRIIIQYCDTKDAKMLEELKTWFSDMNEIQRTCMAKSVLDRARDSYGTELLVPYRDLYRTIREYDISAKSKHETEFLKKLGLLE